MNTSKPSNGVVLEFSAVRTTTRRPLVLERDKVRVLRVRSGLKTGLEDIGTGHPTRQEP